MTSVMEGEGESKYKMINFEETELRLGLPGASADDHGDSALKSSCGSTTGKRGFSQTHSTTTVDLKLNLSSSSKNDSSVTVDKPKENTAAAATTTPTSPPANDPAKPPAKSVPFPIYV